MQFLAEAVRFELTELLHSTVFKTVALNQALPHFHCLVPKVGFEPTTFSLLRRHVYHLRHLGVGGNDRSRTYTVRRMKAEHYRYATLPY